jgi:hypothetical protein
MRLPGTFLHQDQPSIHGVSYPPVSCNMAAPQGGLYPDTSNLLAMNRKVKGWQGAKCMRMHNSQLSTLQFQLGFSSLYWTNVPRIFTVGPNWWSFPLRWPPIWLHGSLILLGPTEPTPFIQGPWTSYLGLRLRKAI